MDHVSETKCWTNTQKLLNLPPLRTIKKKFTNLENSIEFF